MRQDNMIGGRIISAETESHTYAVHTAHMPSTAVVTCCELSRSSEANGSEPTTGWMLSSYRKPTRRAFSVDTRTSQANWPTFPTDTVGYTYATKQDQWQL